MYKVMLIDDEDIIVEGLKKVVKWGDHGCEVVATASCAEEGAVLIRSHNPDILFTDIRMPDQTGLGLLAGLRTEFSQIQVTVLTGYRDFDYAQQAINLGVSRYLLKPSRLEEINEAIEYMVGVLDAQSDGQRAVPDEEAQEGASSFVVRQAVAYIEEHYNEKMALQNVAEHCYISQWYLSKLLHKYLQQSFYEIINKIRILKAKKYLEDPSLSLSNICEIVGYNDPAHFSKVFKRLEGISANEYRSRMIK